MKGRPGEMPQRSRTSASSEDVTTVWPRLRAYASTALITMPRANEGIAWSRARAAASHTSRSRPEPERQRAEVDQLAAVRARLVGARRVLGEVVAVVAYARQRQPPQTLANSQAPQRPPSLRLAQVSEDRRVLPELGEAGSRRLPAATGM